MLDERANGQADLFNAGPVPKPVIFDLSERPIPLAATTGNNGRDFGQGRHNSKRYEDWTLRMLADLRRQGKLWLKLPAPFAVHYTFFKPDNRKRDLGNLLKAADDLLVKAKIIGDDSQIIDHRQSWSRLSPAWRVRIWCGPAALARIEELEKEFQ